MNNTALILLVSFILQAGVPLPPQNLTASAITYTSLTLVWANPATTETAVEVERSLDGGGTFTLFTTRPADAATLQLVGLTPGTAYTFRVRNCNSAGCSAYSNVYTAVTRPLGATATPVPSSTPSLTLTPTPSLTLTPTPAQTRTATPNAMPGVWYNLPTGPVYVAHVYTDGDRAVISLLAGLFLLNLLALLLGILDRRR